MHIHVRVDDNLYLTDSMVHTYGDFWWFILTTNLRAIHRIGAISLTLQYEILKKLVIFIRLAPTVTLFNSSYFPDKILIFGWSEWFLVLWLTSSGSSSSVITSSWSRSSIRPEMDWSSFSHRISAFGNDFCSKLNGELCTWFDKLEIFFPFIEKEYPPVWFTVVPHLFP